MPFPMFSSHRGRIVLSVVLLVIAVFSATDVLERAVKGTPVAHLDARASSYFDGAVKKALATYAAARMLNAAISVVQGTELAVSPAGVGVRLSVGEILDPVNDLVERFSWIMLLSTVSLGIQKVLMEMGVWAGFRVLVLVAMIVLLAGIWLPRRGGLNLRGLGLRLAAVAMVVRFGIPVVGVTGEALYDAFLADTYEESTESLNVIRGKIRMPIVRPDDAVGGEEEAGLLDRLRKGLQDTRDGFNIQARLEALKETAEAGVSHITSLIIVFLLQTVILPLLVLWGLVRLTGSLFRRTWAGAPIHPSPALRKEGA